MVVKRINAYQINLSSKFKEIEDLYYDQVDQLYVKFKDLGIREIPGMELTEFSFVSEWEAGIFSSEDVRDSLDHMDFKQAAKSKLTKKLTALMLEADDELIPFFKHVIDCIISEVVPKMVTYLEMLQGMFNSLSDIDDEQILVTWIEQEISGGQFTTHNNEITFNQLVRQIDTFVSDRVREIYFVADNVVVFDEIPNETSRTINWIFAPKVYIDKLKELYKIKDVLTNPTDLDYLFHIMKGA